MSNLEGEIPRNSRYSKIKVEDICPIDVKMIAKASKSLDKEIQDELNSPDLDEQEAKSNFANALKNAS